MQSISAQNYSIYFNEEGYVFLNSCINNNRYSTIFILVDSNTNAFCAPKFLQMLSTEIPIEIIEIEAGESLKNITTCTEIWTILNELGADRKSLIINLGGGVITDLGGFIAATYKRGIDFINVPTTLLGMVDAAIGGKNGVDLGILKNQIGTITAPKMLLIDTQFLETLPQREMRSGLAEMLKHGLIYDQSYWSKFIDFSNLNTDDLDALIHRSVEIKNEIVSQDPLENGLRKALNFGHTLGHAIESYFLETEKPLLHGEAIAIGMVLESYISKEESLISVEEYSQIKQVVQHFFDMIIFSQNDIEAIIKLLVHDKKTEYGKVQFVLLTSIGKCAINQVVENQEIEKSFYRYLD